MTDGFPQADWEDLRIHFTGIGGIGMSALARIAHARGAAVSGCDSSDSPVLAELRSQGIPCKVGHSAAHVEGADVIIRSSAVPLDAPEVQAAGQRLMSRGRMLAWLQRGCDTIAVAGTHGKTTTTWIIANILIRCGVDPTVAVGGNIRDLGGNWRVGESRFFVAEADESDGSFLHLTPKYPVITNIDDDHMDHWLDINALKRGFVDFAARCRPEDGPVVACADCPNIRDILAELGGRTITYGIGQGDVAAENVRLYGGKAIYDVKFPSGAEKDIVLSLPGMHNVRNSLAALALASELRLPMSRVLEALADTSHVGRRLECRGTAAGVAAYDDYAHHPTEIQATLEAARTMAGRRLIGVFQPHRYTRTQHLHEAFGRVFDKLDLLLIAPIYAACEEPIEGVSSELILRAVQEQGRVPCELVSDLRSAAQRLAAEAQPDDMVITLGAGDVWQVADATLERIRRAKMNQGIPSAGPAAAG